MDSSTSAIPALARQLDQSTSRIGSLRHNRQLSNWKIASARQRLAKSLLRAISAGNRHAYSTLYKQTFNQVYAVAHSLLPSSDDAKEVAGDVYLYVWQNADKYDARRGSIKSWLSIITRNRAIDLRRHQLAEYLDVEAQRQASACLYGEADDPHVIVAQLQRKEELDRAMHFLTPLRRQLIALAFFRQLSHQEIADAMQMPLGTVKSHVRRALATLHAALGAMQPSSPK